MKHTEPSGVPPGTTSHCASEGLGCKGRHLWNSFSGSLASGLLEALSHSGSVELTKLMR